MKTLQLVLVMSFFCTSYTGKSQLWNHSLYDIPAKKILDEKHRYSLAILTNCFNFMPSSINNNDNFLYQSQRICEGSYTLTLETNVKAKLFLQTGFSNVNMVVSGVFHNSKLYETGGFDNTPYHEFKNIIVRVPILLRYMVLKFGQYEGKRWRLSAKTGINLDFAEKLEQGNFKYQPTYNEHFEQPNLVGYTFYVGGQLSNRISNSFEMVVEYGQNIGFLHPILEDNVNYISNTNSLQSGTVSYDGRSSAISIGVKYYWR